MDLGDDGGETLERDGEEAEPPEEVEAVQDDVQPPDASTEKIKTDPSLGESSPPFDEGKLTPDAAESAFGAAEPTPDDLESTGDALESTGGASESTVDSVSTVDAEMASAVDSSSVAVKSTLRASVEAPSETAELSTDDVQSSSEAVKSTIPDAMKFTAPDVVESASLGAGESTTRVTEEDSPMKPPSAPVIKAVDDEEVERRLEAVLEKIRRESEGQHGVKGSDLGKPEGIGQDVSDAAARDVATMDEADGERVVTDSAKGTHSSQEIESQAGTRAADTVADGSEMASSDEISEAATSEIEVKLASERIGKAGAESEIEVLKSDDIDRKEGLSEMQNRKGITNEEIEQMNEQSLSPTKTWTE